MFRERWSGCRLIVHSADKTWISHGNKNTHDGSDNWESYSEFSFRGWGGTHCGWRVWRTPVKSDRSAMHKFASRLSYLENSLYIVNKSMVQNLSSAVPWSFRSQNVVFITVFTKPRLCIIHCSSSIQLKSAHALARSLYFNIILSNPRSSEWALSFGFWKQNYFHISLFHIYGSCHTWFSRSWVLINCEASFM
jgi:hypothetical protein